MIEGLPNPEAVGFDNPKSNWQFKYELRFLSEEKLLTENSKYKPFILDTNEKEETPAERKKRVAKNNKEFDKAWKKRGIVVIKGGISKTQLLEAKNREIVIPVKLTPEIMNVLAKASDAWDNPAFRLKVSGKISLQTNDKLKFKRKFSPNWTCPTKFINRNENKQFWMMNTCGASTEVKLEDGKIVFGYNSRIQ